MESALSEARERAFSLRRKLREITPDDPRFRERADRYAEAMGAYQRMKPGYVPMGTYQMYAWRRWD